MQHNYVVFGEGVTLRPLAIEDLELLRSWRNSDHIRKWFINKKYINSEQQKMWFNQYLDNDSDIFFIIEDNCNLKRPVGAISLYNIDRTNHEAEFGRFMVGDPDARGTGAGRKALRAICEFGLLELELERISLEVIGTNQHAINIYLDLGFIKMDRYVLGHDIIIKMSKALK